jgi:hypothetical protein
MKEGPWVVCQLNAAQLHARVIDELIGLCKGSTADRSINQPEVQCLHQCLHQRVLANQQAADTLLANMIYNSIQQMLTDEVLDDDEAKKLVGVLSDLCGGGHQAKH